MGIPAQRVGNSVVAAKFMRVLSHHHELALCSTRNGRARGVLVPPTVATSARPCMPALSTALLAQWTPTIACVLALIGTGVLISHLQVHSWC